jgi:hypothetical protein
MLACTVLHNMNKGKCYVPYEGRGNDRPQNNMMFVFVFPLMVMPFGGELGDVYWNILKLVIVTNYSTTYVESIFI